jgi:hypothetical protein
VLVAAFSCGVYRRKINDPSPTSRVEQGDEAMTLLLTAGILFSFLAGFYFAIVLIQPTKSEKEVDNDKR